MRRVLAVTLFTAAFAAASAVYAHGDEDHGAAPPPVTQSMSPRAVAATEDFEVVAILDGKHLVVYVDRFASNEPVVKAKVEVEGAGLKGLASEAAPGTYVMDLAAALAPAKHALTISIEAGETADLLSATLDTSQPVVAAADAHGWTRRTVWIVAALLLLAAGALLVIRRRKAGGI